MAERTKRLIQWLERRLHEIGRKWRICWGGATDPPPPWLARLPALAGLVYVASPIDLVPDWFPAFGSLDDAFVLAAATALSVRCVPASLLAEHKARAGGDSSGSARQVAESEWWPLYWAM